MTRSDLKRSHKNSNIDISDDESDDFVNLNNTNDNKNKLTFDEHQKKYDRINKEMIEREVTMADVLALDLPMDEYIWFVEYLGILKQTAPFSEDKYRITNMIYKKYENLKSVNMEKLDKIKHDSNVGTDIVNRILNSDHTDKVKAILYKKYKRYYDNAGGSSDEFLKIMDWLIMI